VLGRVRRRREWAGGVVGAARPIRTTCGARRPGRDGGGAWSVPLRMDQRTLVGLGMRAQRGRNVGDARRQRGRRTLERPVPNSFGLACFDRVKLQIMQHKCSKV
jgi:hypothetical protein